MKIFRWIGVLVALALIVSAIYFRDRGEPLALTEAIASTRLPVIVIDAGHGGIDGGTSGADGTVEKHINLSIAKKLEQILRTFGFSVVMTRIEDDLISDPSLPTIRARKHQDILERLAISESISDSVLVSIHQNYFESSIYSGAQVFYSPNHADGEPLAKAIQHSIVSRIQPDNTRQVKATGSEIYLLHHSTHPAVMVECGFMSNPKELSDLKNDRYQSQMAFCIAVALADYYCP